jgi:hypothetical protein
VAISAQTVDKCGEIRWHRHNVSAARGVSSRTRAHGRGPGRARVAENAGDVIYAGVLAVRFHLTVKDLSDAFCPVFDDE